MNTIDTRTQQPQLHNLFSTPVFVNYWAEAAAKNQALLEFIQGLHSQDEGVRRSNVGGWHSSNNFFDLGHHVIDELRAFIGQTFVMFYTQLVPTLSGKPMRMNIGGWANIVPPGGYHIPHNHSGHGWSGCYYIQANTSSEPDNPAGKIELIDPRVGANNPALPGRPFISSVSIAPQPGMLLFFPSWLNHMVHPNNDGGERVTVAFNIDFPRPRRVQNAL